MNRERLQQKRQLINLIRSFFEERDFFELETPLLVPSPGMEVHLHGFETDYVDHSGLKQHYYLPTSPEFALKKALGSGFEKVFEIARVFRNHGELGMQHHPEFNMLEWYRPGDYLNIMDDVDALLAYLGQQFVALEKDPVFRWDINAKRTSLQDCFKEYAALDLEQGLSDPDYWHDASMSVLGESIPEDDQFEDVFFRVWMKLIEPNLGIEQAEIVYDYPASMSALSKIKTTNQNWSERFELYIKGVEIGNAFSELTDSVEQLARFEEANLQRVKLGYPPHPVDYELIQSIAKMNATGGIAMGIERLLMVLTGESDIRKFFLYPVGDARRRKN